MSSHAHDGPLRGGTANHGRVHRVGDTVHRPRGPHAPAVHALLQHLQAGGFDGAPGVRGVDGGTEILDYMHGISAVEPLAPWARVDLALRSVGELLRRFHSHTASFPDAEGRRWQRQVPLRWRGPLIAHNDVNPANVVFQDGRAVALIDFDLAAPAVAAWDLTVTACFWAPLRDGADVPDERTTRRLDRVAVLLDGYAAAPDLRLQVAEAVPDANRWIADIIRDAAERGHPAFGRVWELQAAMYARADQWIAGHRADLVAAVR